MVMASTIHIFTISLGKQGDYEYHVEVENDECTKTEINDSNKKSKFISPYNIAEEYSIIHKEECFQKDSTTLPAQTTLEDITKPQNEQYTTESSCLPENNIYIIENKDQSITNKHSSVIPSSSTHLVSSVAHNSKKSCQDHPYEATLQPQNATEPCSTSSTPEILSQPQNIADNSQTYMTFTHETSLTQSSVMSCPIANYNTVLQKDCTSTLTTSVAELPYRSLENLQQCFASPQNEHKFFSVSTIGPPPLYEPTLYYEPPDFYEAPPAYTTFPLESLSDEEISQYYMSENREDENVSHFRKEVMRFVVIIFLVISAMYMVTTVKHK